jgi:hypothetical protein
MKNEQVADNEKSVPKKNESGTVLGTGNLDNFIWFDTLNGEIAVRHYEIQAFCTNRILVSGHWINVYAELDDIANWIKYWQVKK